MCKTYFKNNIMKYMLMFFKSVCLFLFLLSISGCMEKHCSNIKEASKWKGKQLILPAKNCYSQFGRDSVIYDIANSSYKILVLIGKEECISCKFNIGNWKNLILEVDSITSSKTEFIIIMEPLYQREIYTMLKSYNFLTPICIDNNCLFRKTNKMSDSESHGWLVDPNNRIINIGDPTINKNVYNDYLNMINSHYLFND